MHFLNILIKPDDLAYNNLLGFLLTFYVFRPAVSRKQLYF